MMGIFKTPVSVLEDAVGRFEGRPAFLVPRVSSSPQKAEGWDPVSYQEFHHDVAQSARHWLRSLSSSDIRPRSIVGLWVSGTRYVDAVHIYGLMRADYIPQLFSLRLSYPGIVSELLQRSGAQALIVDPSFKSAVVGSSVPTYVVPDLETLHLNVDCEALPPIRQPLDGDEISMIYHTSGSSSGSPKLVPCTVKWINASVQKIAPLCRPHSQDRQGVATWIGSMCHIAQSVNLLGFMQHGSCTVQPTQIPFAVDELMRMMTDYNLTRLNTFASHLATLLRESRTNPALLDALRGIDEIVYCGLALQPDDQRWARCNGISFKNEFGSTEVGTMLSSVGGTGDDSTLLEACSGTAYEMMPVTPGESEAEEGTLLELVVLPSSGDIPHHSLRGGPDQPFHTGDLFTEATPGRFISRGRSDDWIKSSSALRCDTAAIENNVMATCGEDLVAACVVVGHGRPSPTLFVEAKVGDEAGQQGLKARILERTKEFHLRRYEHERINSIRFIQVVEQGTLPRTITKGNIRRRAVEELFTDVLNQIYSRQELS